MTIAVSRPAPETLQNLRNLADGRLADEDRHDLDLAQRALDEGKLHLEAVFADEGLWRHRHPGLARQGVAGGAVDGEAAERRLPSVGRRQGDPAHRHAMGRPQHHDPLELAAAPGQQAVSAAGDIAGVDVAGMGGDHGLRRQGRRRGLGQAQVDARGQLSRIGRIEQAGDAGGLRGVGHGWASFGIGGEASIPTEAHKAAPRGATHAAASRTATLPCDPDTTDRTHSKSSFQLACRW